MSAFVEHLRPVGELRDHLGFTKLVTSSRAHARAREQLDQAHLLGGRDDLRLVLEPVPRPDLANVDAIAHAYIMPRPPLTPIVSPVTYEASSDARYATAAATSSGRPIRPSAVFDTMPFTSRSPSSPRCSGRRHQQRRLDRPRRDRVAAHLVARALLRDRLREADHPGLRARVRRRPRRADPAGLRRDVDDRPSAALLHAGQHGVRDGQDADQVHADHEVPHLGRRVDEEAERVGARVVHEDVDRRRPGRPRP